MDFLGSSPLARGLPAAAVRESKEVRIIPARAGFTSGSTRTPTPTRDHPRSRGVYLTGRSTHRSPFGSSPLARGLQDIQGDQIVKDRIIPARAGFTPPRWTASSWPRDHPRSRGVYADWFTAYVVPVGSSPLARGLREEIRHHLHRGRIIPARAGFTDAQLVADLEG